MLGSSGSVFKVVLVLSFMFLALTLGANRMVPKKRREGVALFCFYRDCYSPPQ